MEILNLSSIKQYLAQTELVDGAKKIWTYAESHLSIAIRVGLVVYGALVIYSAVFMQPANVFAETGTLEDIKNWVFLAARLAICVVGLVGEFFGYRICLKLFIVLVCIDGLTGIITVVLSDPTGIVSMSNRQAVEDMFAAQGSYNWAPNSKNSDSSMKWKNKELVADITQIWDGLQSGGCCCGVDGYDNWDRLRPEGYPDNSYPSSCCDRANVTVDSDPSVSLCDVESVYQKGCRKVVEEAGSDQMNMTFWIGVFEIGLAIVGYQVYKHCDPDHPSYEQMRNHEHLMRMHMQNQSPYNKPIKPSFKGSKNSKSHWVEEGEDHRRYGSMHDGKDTYILSGDHKFTPRP